MRGDQNFARNLAQRLTEGSGQKNVPVGPVEGEYYVVLDVVKET
jgi:hypothetical protein